MFRFNPFSSNKLEVSEHIAEKNENFEQKDNVSENSESDLIHKKENPFDRSLSDLKEAISIQKELGGKISPEQVFEMTGMQPNELLSYLEGKEIKIDESELSEIMEPIKTALESIDEEYKDESKFKKFANNKVTRAAFVAAMLFLKFAPNAKASDTSHLSKDKDGVKKEWSAEKKTEPDMSKTFVVSEKDFEKNIDTENPVVHVEDIEDISKIELTNYFVTDSENIPDNSQKIIADQFKTFLGKINQNNVGEILKSDFTIYGSSDERPTSNWNGSNEVLTSARISAIDNLLTSVLQSYHFEGLDDDLVKQIKAKTFSHSMPMHNDGKENGVTYITDLKNPQTGNNYTQEEVNQLKENNIEKYNNLLDKCRTINFSAEIKQIKADKEKLNPIEPLSPKIETSPSKPSINRLAEFNNIILLFDNSPSMGNSYKYIASAVNEQIKDTNHNIHFGQFSDRLTGLEKCSSPDDVYKNLDKMDHKGSSDENSLSSVIKALDKIESPKEGEKSILLLMTDESFQDVSAENLKQLDNLANEKNVEMKFMYGSDNKGEVKEIKLSDLNKAYKETVKGMYKGHYESKVKSISTYIESLKSLYENKKENFERGSKVITQDDLNDFKNKLDKKIIELENLKKDWSSGEVKQIIENETLKNVKFNGKALDDRYTVTIAGDNIGEKISA